jgi:hypothetical protein
MALRFDVKSAYLYATLKETIYMQIPHGMTWDGTQMPDTHVLKIEKGLYGLPQAGAEWNTHFHDTLLKEGFTHSIHTWLESLL